MAKGIYSTYDFRTEDGVVKAKAEIVAIIGGHMHYDYVTETNDGVPIIFTDCDAGNRAVNNNERPAASKFVRGTITEQAFDVITINYSTKVIKAVRIGRGVEAVRTFTRS